MSDSLWPNELQHVLSFTISQSLFKLLSIESVMPSNHLILCHHLFLLPSVFLSIRFFSSEWALHIRRSKYWSFSFSISPSSEYSGFISLRIDWSPCCLRDSQESSPVIFWKHQLFGAQPSYGPTLTSIYDYRKNHNFDCMDLCQQSDVSAF